MYTQILIYYTHTHTRIYIHTHKYTHEVFFTQSFKKEKRKYLGTILRRKKGRRWTFKFQNTTLFPV